MENRRALYIIIVSLFVMTGCLNKSLKHAEDQEERMPIQYEFSHKDQLFQVVYLFEEVSEFTEIAGKDEAVQLEELYYDNVIKPFETSLGYKESLGDSTFFSYDTDLDKLGKNAKELGERLEEIHSLIEESLLLSAKNLPSSDVKVFIMPMNPDDYFGINHMGGVSGVAATNGEFIILQLDPSYKKETLQYALAHEYNHTVVLKNQDKINEDIMELVILEGKADVFAKELYPHIEVPWIEPLSDDEIEKVLEEIKNHPDDYDTYVKLQQGTNEYPVWSNYRLGYIIMESYLEKNDRIPLSKWTYLKKEEIITGSDYSHLINH